MWRKLLATPDDWVSLVARLGLGLVMFPHGAQKMLGWFGGYGFHGTLQFFTGAMHLPALLGVLAILAEFLGSLGLIAGLLGRIAAFGIGCNMVAAVLMVHGQNGFFMDWAGNQKGEGFEYHILALTLVVIVLVRGSGKASLDRVLAA
ncbi:MAG: DoxX family protein [Terriglobales bacterium]